MIFLSDGSIEFDASGVGMMDLWAGSHFLRVQGDATYVQGMQKIREMELQKPNSGLQVVQSIPEARAD